MPHTLIGAAAAPEVPAAALFLVGLLAGITAVFLVFLRFGAVTLIGGLLRWLVKQLPHIPYVSDSVNKFVNAGVNAVDEVLGAAISASSGLAITTLHDSWKLTLWVGDALAGLATSTAHAINVLVTSTIPAAVEHPVRFVQKQLDALIANVTHLQQTIKQNVAAAVAALTATVARNASRAEHAIASAEHSITTAVPRLVGREVADVRGWTQKQLRRLSRRLTRVEEAVGLTALAGVIVAVIAREIPWVRCRNVGKVGKTLCGMPVSQLERLLADFALGATAIFGTLSLETLAKDTQKLVGGLGGEVRHFWRADVKAVARDRQPGQPGA